jgi:hypothetical protein
VEKSITAIAIKIQKTMKVLKIKGKIDVENYVENVNNSE